MKIQKSWHFTPSPFLFTTEYQKSQLQNFRISFSRAVSSDCIRKVHLWLMLGGGGGRGVTVGVAKNLLVIACETRHLTFIMLLHLLPSQESRETDFSLHLSCKKWLALWDFFHTLYNYGKHLTPFGSHEKI